MPKNLVLDISIDRNGSYIRFKTPDGNGLQVSGDIDFINQALEEIFANCPNLLGVLRQACSDISPEEFNEKFQKALASVAGGKHA